MSEETQKRTNDTVKQALAEDAKDFDSFKTREHETDYIFEDVVADLKRRGKI